MMKHISNKVTTLLPMQWKFEKISFDGYYYYCYLISKNVYQLKFKWGAVGRTLTDLYYCLAKMDDL